MTISAVYDTTLPALNTKMHMDLGVLQHWSRVRKVVLLSSSAGSFCADIALPVAKEASVACGSCLESLVARSMGDGFHPRAVVAHHMRNCCYCWYFVIPSLALFQSF